MNTLKTTLATALITLASGMALAQTAAPAAPAATPAPAAPAASAAAPAEAASAARHHKHHKRHAKKQAADTKAGDTAAKTETKTQ